MTTADTPEAAASAPIDAAPTDSARERAGRVLDDLGDGIEPRDRRIAQELLASALDLVTDRPQTLDLKIAAAALREMREAFAVFAPYRDAPKVTIFGSARTRTDDPLYNHTRKVAELLAARGWMVVTGAGPGIMEAGMRGAGRERSIGVAIRLPFEQAANSVIAGDHKYVSMKYFFTRKLMLVKESKGFVCLPGGFGTLDETFELLTLVQTGKGMPVPIVMLDCPGDAYWEKVHELIAESLVPRGMVAAADTDLYLVTSDCEEAVDEITRFYENYDSLRYIGDLLILRVRRAPPPERLAELSERFARLIVQGELQRIEPHPLEVREGDRLGLERVAFRFARHGFGELRRLIDALNAS